MFEFFKVVILNVVNIAAFICALIILYYIYRFIRHHPFKQVPKEYLKGYLNERVKEQDYAEAEYVRKILVRNGDKTHIRLPLCLTFKQETDYVDDYDSPWGFKKKKKKYIKRRFGNSGEHFEFNESIRIAVIICIVVVTTAVAVWGAKNWRKGSNEDRYNETENSAYEAALLTDTIPVNLRFYLNLGLPLRIGHCLRDTVNWQMDLIRDSSDLRYHSQNHSTAQHMDIYLTLQEKQSVDSARKHYHLVPLKTFRKKGHYVTLGMRILDPNGERIQWLKTEESVNRLNTDYPALDSQYLQLAKDIGRQPDVYKVILDSIGYSQYLKKSKKARFQ